MIMYKYNNLPASLVASFRQSFLKPLVHCFCISNRHVMPVCLLIPTLYFIGNITSSLFLTNESTGSHSAREHVIWSYFLKVIELAHTKSLKLSFFQLLLS